LHLHNTGQAAQIAAVNAREIFGIGGDDFQQIIGAARHQVTFQHIGHARHLALERIQTSRRFDRPA
jgi:hypothetical protein